MTTIDKHVQTGNAIPCLAVEFNCIRVYNIIMINRSIGNYIFKLAEKFPIISVSGPRQSGKTTLLKSLFTQYKYVNLENLDERALVAEDIRGFLRQHADAGIVIDEAQRLPELFSYLQGFVDDSRKMGRIIISGSQNFLLMESISQSLAGRVGLVNLMPFTISELENTEHWQKDPFKFIFKGMYPAVYDRNIEPLDYYPNYLLTYIERDVRNLKNISDLNLFRRFLQLCAGRAGQVINYTSMGNDLGIDHKTVKAWVSVLEASFIIFLLNPHYKNFSKRIIKQPKLYFYDTGVAATLLNLKSSDELFSHYMKGNLFENFIISEYLKLRLHSGLRSDAWFFRDKTGNEIDLIIDRPEGLIPVEIKAGMTISTDFFKGLIKYREISGVPTDSSYLIYSGEDSQQRKDAWVLSWKDLKKLIQ